MMHQHVAGGYIFYARAMVCHFMALLPLPLPKGAVVQQVFRHGSHFGALVPSMVVGHNMNTFGEYG